MSNPDPQQSFTASLTINGQPVALVSKVLQRKLLDPDLSESLRRLYEEALETSPNLMTFGEDVAPDKLLFAYHDGVYIIKIEDNFGNFTETLSMETSVRNWTVFNGDDPTYFRIKNNYEETLTLADMPNELNDILLYSGPQHREVCTYGEEPNFSVITDLPNRGGQLAVFELKIIKRSTPDGH